MNTFITNNANAGLFINCIGVLDNDPSSGLDTTFYNSAQYLNDLANNFVLQGLTTIDASNTTITTYRNLNLNPNKYRITVIAPDGLVVFDSNAGMSANKNAKLPNAPVIAANHFNRSCVLRALL